MAKANRTIKKASKPVNKGGAPKGNTNAEVWTKETTLAKLEEVQQEAKRGNVYYIGQALANLGLYHEWYAYVADKFKDDKVVFNTIKAIDQTFEAKLVGKTLEGDLNPTMAIFTLKNKHNWKDKTETENKNQNTNYNSEPLTPEKIKEIRKNLENEC